MWIGSCLTRGDHLFFQQFLEAFFSLQIRKLGDKLLQNGPKIESTGSYFLETVWKWKTVFGLRRRVRIAYEPTPWSAQGDQKNEEKKQPISEPLFFTKNIEMLKKRAPKGTQK